MKRLVTYVILMALFLTGCAAPADPDTAQESIQVIAMDTAMLITTYGEHSVTAAYAAEDVIRDLEAKLSRTDPDSEVSRLNAAGGETVSISQDTFALLRLAERCRMKTEGAFDITVAPLVAAWGFAGGEEYRVPSQEELDALLPLVDGSAVFTDSRSPEGEEYKTSGDYEGEWTCTAALEPGQAIDLGGIAKGCVSDLIVRVFQEYDIPRANVSLGGNVLAWGTRPDGAPWRVGIQDPARAEESGAYAGILELTDSFAVTSGGYQRYFEEDGKIYHHIIDPSTGCPADSGLTSVTVVADAFKTSQPWMGALCDAYSTALFVMGEEKALDFWRGCRDLEAEEPLFQLVLVTKDGRVLITEGLADRFTLGEDSGYAYEVVS